MDVFMNSKDKIFGCGIYKILNIKYKIIKYNRLID